MIGNSSDRPEVVAPSGDVTISNTGVTTIGAGAVDIAMLSAAEHHHLLHIYGDNTWATPSGGGVPLPTYTACASGCDYSTIQGALDAATGGGVIYLTDNSYTITSTLLYKYNYTYIVGNKSVLLSHRRRGFSNDIHCSKHNSITANRSSWCQTRTV